MTRTLSIIAANLSILNGLVVAADAWPTFQNGGTTSVASSGLLKLGDVLWTIDLRGYGQSSPVVWEGNVYVTTVEGAKKEQCHVAAFSLNNGSQLWESTFENPSPQENNNYVSRAAPTPVADANGIVCFFEGGIVVALDHGGKERWRRNLVEDYGGVGARHGLSSSLEQDEASVFVWVERSEEPYVARLSKADGETIWKSAGVGATSWASPRLVPVDGGQQLVLSAIGILAGFDVESGEQLWKFDGISGNSTPTPMPLGNGRFLIGATVGRGESGGGKAAASNGVIQIKKGDDGKWSAAYAWQAKRATSSFGSPIVHEGLAFFVNREGVLYGLNAESGEEIFAKRLKGSSWATPIGVGDQVFFFGKDGKVDRVSDLQGKQTVATWSSLPEPPKREEGEGTDGTARRGRPMFSGPVMYAAVWCGDEVLMRQGDRLFAVAVTQDPAVKASNE